MIKHSGWYLYDKDADDPADRPNPDDLAESRRVVGIGAICDFATGAPELGPSQSFSIQEYVELEDGRHVVLSSDRSFTISPVRRLVELEDGRRVVLENVAPAHAGLTPDSIRQDVLNAVLPDDDESGEAHPWSWLAERARVQGIGVTADELKALSYEVILTKRLAEWLMLS